MQWYELLPILILLWLASHTLDKWFPVDLASRDPNFSLARVMIGSTVIRIVAVSILLGLIFQLDVDHLPKPLATQAIEMIHEGR